MWLRRRDLNLLALSALAVPLPALAQRETIKIGANLERTGVNTSYGVHVLIAAQIALDEINRAGGINGVPLELVVEDNRSSPEQAVIAVRNLDRAGVFAVLGPITTNHARTAFPAANRAGLVSISPGSAAPGLTAQNRPWTFRIAALDAVIADAVVTAVRKNHPNAKRVAVAVDPRDAYYQFLAKTVAPPVLERHGMTIVNKDALVEVPSDTTDFSVFVTRIKALQPDAVLLSTTFEPAHGFLREANRQKLTVPFFSALGYLTNSVGTAAGDIELWAGQPFDAEAEDPEVRRFATEFKARVDKELPGQYTTPTYIDAGAYETVRIIADALRAGKVTPQTDPKQARETVRDYLTGLKNYRGLGNVIDVNAEGDAVKPTFVYRTQNGRWVKQ